MCANVLFDRTKSYLLLNSSPPNVSSLKYSSYTIKPLSLANLTIFLAGSTPSTLAPNFDNGSNKTPSLQPISNIFLPFTSYPSSSILATSLK